ncbi:MAG: ATP-binding protein, partial [bacterium]|nr:ATP-binding protein [bacterium]
MQLEIISNTGSTVTFIAGFVMLITGVIVFTRDREKKSNYLFFLLSLSASLWSVTLGFFEITHNQFLEKYLLILVYITAAIIPLALLFFSIALATERIKLSRFKKILVWAPFIFIVTGLLIPDFILKNKDGFDGVAKTIAFGKWFPLYVAYIIGYLIASIGVMIKRYHEGAGIFKVELRDILLSTVTAIIFTLSTNLFLPNAGIFKYFWIGPIILVFTFLMVGYLIIKYNFWNLKLIATELFASLIIMTLVIEILITTSIADFITKLGITLFVVFSSVFLIRSVRNEVEAKEEVERLLNDLAYANQELQSLDRRKSEFLSIASHHLRDPLTAIKGYASMLLEGSFGGELGKDVKEAMEKIFESSKRLVTIIEDFLNITQIEQGEMAYQFTAVNLKKLLSDVVEELSPSALRSGLELHFIGDGVSPEGSVIAGDTGKLRQVITNLIDNSIKYTPKGSVRVMIVHTEHKGQTYLQLSVNDTGIGMDTETQEKIFNKFSRAEGVSKLYTDGSGLGLYVAKEILKKHNGRIWAESEGLGKGS